MPETVRLKLVEQPKPRGFFFRRSPPAPDTVLIGQAKLRVADACIEQLRIFSSLEDQVDTWELVEKILRDAERRKRAYEEAEL